MPASLTDLYATTLDPMVVLGHDHRITLASEGMRQILGRAPDELLGELLPDLVHPTDRQWIRATLTRLSRNAEEGAFDGRLLHVDGGVRWMSWSFRRSPEGVVYGLGRDESVRREVERMVRLREKRRKAMLDHAADPLVVLDGRGRIVDVNEAAATLFGQRQDQLVGQGIVQHVPAFARAGLRHPHPFEARLETQDGPVDLEIRTRSFSFEDEVMIVAIARDIRRHKQHAEQLASLSIRATLENEAKSSFVAELSHALRTPLSAIVGYTELMLESGDPLVEAERVREAADWLLDLTDDVLDLERIAVGALRLDRERVDLSELLDDLLETLGDRLPPVDLDIRARPTDLDTDPARLRQVVVNVLVDAARRASTGLRVVVRDTEAEGRATVAIEIHDDGPGMDLDELQRAFEPFATGARGRDQSAGLGLAIARRLCEALGGHLTAASQRGQGSVFTAFLPRLPTTPS